MHSTLRLPSTSLLETNWCTFQWVNSLYDPFKDVKDGVLLDEEEIAMEDEAIDEEQGVEE